MLITERINKHFDHFGFSKKCAFLLSVLTIITAFFRYMLPIRDGDIWFHLAYAEYFVKFKTLIPNHSLYSLSPTANTEVYCAWLAELFFHALFSISGVAALITFRYFCIALFVLIAILYARKNGVLWTPLTWLIILVSLLMSYVAIYAKPEIFTWVLFTLMTWNWWNIRSNPAGKISRCYLFPVLMVVWVNSHGAFIFGALFLVVVMLGELCNSLFFPNKILPHCVRRHLLVAFVITAFSMLLTPYGVKYPVQLLGTLTPSPDRLEALSQIAAFTRPLSAEANTLLFAHYVNVAVIIFVGLVFKNIKTKELECSAIFSFLVFVVLYTQFWRTTFFLAPIFLFTTLSLIKSSVIEYQRKKYYFTTIVLIVSFLLAFLTIKEAIFRPERGLWVGFGVNENTPIEEVNFVANQYPEAKVANTYGVGSYFLWARGPEKKIMLDARHFPYVGWLDEYWMMRKTGKNIEQFISKYPSDVWVVEIFSDPILLRWFRHSKDWQLAFYGKAAAIFVKSSIFTGTNVYHGESVSNVKSTSYALPLFLFASTIGDWSVANDMIKNLKNRPLVSYDDYLKSMAEYSSGYNCYRKKRYMEAIKHLLQSAQHIKDDTILISSYSLAIKKLWDVGKVEKALLLAEEAYFFAPSSIVNKYNLAVINWYISKESNSTYVDPKNWQAELVEIERLMVAAGSTRRQYISVVKGILDGTYSEMPPVISFQKQLEGIESIAYDYDEHE